MERRGRILVVEDDAATRTELCEVLREEGYAVDSAPDAFKALPKLEAAEPEVVLTDLHMPGMGGIDLLGKARERDPECAVVVMTAYASVDSAVAAMKAGATDYLTKPINIEELLLVIERALERRRLRLMRTWLRQEQAQQRRLHNIVGQSPAMQPVFNTILQVAPTRATVLITGESGTGKELIASAIHEHSPRADGPLVKLHCAALAETLLESELFGHEKGAFTGAVQRRDGLFQAADRGTLFLDEIGEISPAIQVKLLRFLQEHEFTRVGGNQTIQVDVRIIAATNRDLRKRMAEGLFREDLYYRLNVVSIEVPPLRERMEDVPLIAAHLLRRFAQENGKKVSGFSERALACLGHYSWPGNVRELANAIERAVIVSRSEEIDRDDLPPWVVAGAEAASATPAHGIPQIPGASMAEIERYAIVKTLQHTGGSTSKAAEILGISVRKIQYRLQEYHKADRAAKAR